MEIAFGDQFAINLRIAVPRAFFPVVQPAEKVTAGNVRKNK